MKNNEVYGFSQNRKKEKRRENEFKNNKVMLLNTVNINITCIISCNSCKSILLCIS